MNTLILPIEANGTLVEVSIGLSAADARLLRQAGKPLPAPVTIRALIDTGAEATAVDASVLTPLVSAGIPPARFLFVNLPAAGQIAMPTPEYAVSLAFADLASGKPPIQPLRNFSVIEQPLLA